MYSRDVFIFSQVLQIKIQLVWKDMKRWSAWSKSCVAFFGVEQPFWGSWVGKALVWSTLGILSLMGVSVSAQEQFGGIPRGVSLSQELLCTTRSTSIASDQELSIDDLCAQIAWQSQSEGGMMTIGRYFPLPPEEHPWIYRKNENIWQMALHFSGAGALSVAYSRFAIPEGASLFIYDLYGKTILGAYTHASAPQNGGAFATSMLPSDVVILEYQPSPKGEAPEIVPESLGVAVAPLHELRAYRDHYDWPGEDNSGSCMVNVACPEGDAWRNEQRSIAFIQTKVGAKMAVCSGTLLNNSQNDGTPYLITAAHCAGVEPPRANAEDFSRWIFYFHYDKPSCDNQGSAGARALSLVGAEELAQSTLEGGTDGLFLRLKQSVPETYNLYFAGWDRSESLPTSGVGLHHPSGDATKVSTFKQSPQVTEWNEKSQPKAHFNVHYAATENGHAITEKGSSGSGLFSSSHRLIGTLTGGNASCKNLEGTNMYGRLARHYTTMNLGQWLAPSDPQLWSLEGTYPKGNRPPVQNLIAWSGAQGVEVRWSAPQEAKPTAYHLYADNQKIRTIAPQEELVVRLSEEETKSREISVEAIYEPGRSLPIRVYIPLSVDHQPLEGVEVHDGVISWKQPRLGQIWSFVSEIRTQELIRRGDLPAPTFFYTAVRYGAEQLQRSSMWNKSITAVRFVPISSEAIPYIYIKQGEKTYSQKVELPTTLGSLLEVELATPFALNEVNSLYVGIRYRGNTQKEFVTMAAEPQKLAQSMLVSLDGDNWFEYPTLTHSLALEVVVHSSAQKDLPSWMIQRSESPCYFPQIVGYRVVYDGVEIGRTNAADEASFHDAESSKHPDSSKYQVFPLLSSESTIGVQTPTLPRQDADYSVVGNALDLSASEAMAEVQLLDTQGVLLLSGTTSSIHSPIALSPGLYLLKIRYKNGTQKVHKVLIP